MDAASSSFITALLLAGWLATVLCAGILITYLKSVFDSGHLGFGLKPFATPQARLKTARKSEALYGLRNARANASWCSSQGKRGAGGDVSVLGSQKKSAAGAARHRHGNQHSVSQQALDNAHQQQNVDTTSVCNKILEQLATGNIERGYDVQESNAAFGGQDEQKKSMRTSPSARAPRITAKQRSIEARCRELLETLSCLKERLAKYNTVQPTTADGAADSAATTTEPDVEYAECVKSCCSTIRQLRVLFERFNVDFQDDRQGYVTAMILCCNVIIKLDALSLIKSLQSYDSVLEEDGQFIIETVVPNIWSI